ncbi:MAG: tetratricopeptide repeat protein [Candidatus Tectomicrobia bacterium]|uniref:Tetratricopeptide repeat protein n=1 Tax=Tectimicrobiota bacterium TaxID=2528274 RepID=A0A932ZSI8_UNCTE|nr:tetratricopeptide repeat protein [Candidatus Tectomicrobia bacterium]
MRLRPLLAFAGPLAAALYLLHFNRDFVSVRFSEAWSVRAPMAMALLAAALAGAFAAALLGWGEAALRAFAGWKERRLVRRQEGARECLARAQRLRGQGRPKKALRLARRAIRLDSRLPLAYSLAADLAAEAGNLEEAIRWNSRLYALWPDSPDAAVRLSENLEATGKAGEAERVLARSGGNGKIHPAVMRKLRDLFAASGRWEEAVQACEKLHRTGGVLSEQEEDARRTGEIFLAAAEGRLARSDSWGAVSLLEDAVRRLPSSRKLRLRLGEALAAAGKPKRALRAWEAGYREVGGEEFLRRIAASQGPLDSESALRQASSRLVSAAGSRPGDPAPWVMAAALLIEAGRTEEALRWLGEASGLIPAAAEGEAGWMGLAVRLLEARAKLEGGDRLAAENDFRRVAREAGWLLLGESPSGAIVKPFDVFSS